MANVYDFRSGRSLRGVNPQKVGEELDRIRSERGELTADGVLEEAIDPASPLHAGFEWDDTEAARQHRLGQARRLITSIRVINSPAGPSMPAFVNVRTPDKGRGYVPAVEAFSDEELRARVLAEARQMVEAMERRYAHYQGVADILDRLKKSVG